MVRHILVLTSLFGSLVFFAGCADDSKTSNKSDPFAIDLPVTKPLTTDQKRDALVVLSDFAATASTVGGENVLKGMLPSIAKSNAKLNEAFHTNCKMNHTDAEPEDSKMMTSISTAVNREGRSCPFSYKEVTVTTIIDSKPNKMAQTSSKYNVNYSSKADADISPVKQYSLGGTKSLFANKFDDGLLHVMMKEDLGGQAEHKKFGKFPNVILKSRMKFNQKDKKSTGRTRLVYGAQMAHGWAVVDVNATKLEGVKKPIVTVHINGQQVDPQKFSVSAAALEEQ